MKDGMVCVDQGKITILPFEEFTDPKTGRSRVRLVDLNSEHYKVAKSYMIRLTKKDLEDPMMLAKLASAAKMTPQQFLEKFSKVAD
jgi:6-phosphofructokinase 1